ncbi:hypothetical protein HELRODRAFT_76975 [Helobdella robusta]|uniref:RRM domain-containing protein n=1 Tax=Helobdella robusta TaxID=6412 RepID=T1G2S1_HELRO|nr:hypothetical protein HELRODRAFT_76975 [Helobdella robusta]ESO06935.1 hypothetical protein HELRODRAFT_76975 [Helobdella robusta]
MGRSPSPTLEENKAFVRGLTEDVDESMITSYFSKYGRVTEVYLARDFETKLPRGFAFVTFENSKDCENACKTLNGKVN